MQTVSTTTQTTTSSTIPTTHPTIGITSTKRPSTTDISSYNSLLTTDTAFTTTLIPTNDLNSTSQIICDPVAICNNTGVAIVEVLAIGVTAGVCIIILIVIIALLLVYIMMLKKKQLKSQLNISVYVKHLLV